jgi:haloalkane dehalogenase
LDDTWVNRTEYPFQPHFLQLPAGRMHYVDEGQGRPVLMVHGTPTWSFLYRHLIRGLSADYRVIAPDHIGFGLSDKPQNWTYLPSDHASNLEQLIHELDLNDLTLVVHDFGGPIGLSYAVAHPDRIRNLVLFNTFMWSLQGDPSFERPARIFNNALGKFAYTRLNFSAKIMIPAAWGDKRKLNRTIQQQYVKALPDSASRQGTWVFLKELIGSSSWYEQLWKQRDQIQDKPALILWGMKDIAFKEKELSRWEQLFSSTQVIRYPQTGHFVPEEEGQALVPIIRGFLDDSEGSIASD